MISIIVLTFNSEQTIGPTLAAARQVSDDVHVVDSFSSDATLEIARSHGAHIVQHPFENYGAQRNWAIQNLDLKYGWQLHLDADEYLGPALIAEINDLKTRLPEKIDGFFIPRMTRFMGRELRFGGYYPIWHMRLFRNGKGRCEQRRYDQHFYVEGQTARLHHPMIDDNRMPITEWTARHNHWADEEARELLEPTLTGVVAGRWKGNAVEKKRALRGYYYRLPLLLRPALFFIYRYFIRLGFLDGKPGLIYCTLQTFWFRFLVDSKLLEHRMRYDPNS